MRDMKSEILYADAYIKDKSCITQKEVDALLEAAVPGCEIHFGKGTYCFREWVSHPNTSIAHDDGCGDIFSKDCHMVLSGLSGVTLCGETREDGTPETVLAGYNSCENQTLLPSVLWAEECLGLTVRDLVFTREPECASAGEIVKIEDGKIFVRVFPGNPCRDHMAAYCMNRFDIKKKALLGESLTFGFGYDKEFQLASEGLLMLEDEELAQRLSVGEGLSWHQAGKTDFLLLFGKCDGLCLENVRIYNTNAFAILTENCCNIRAERLVMAPKGNQFFTGSRDGWKIYRCTGKIEVKDCVTEGVRMDGQNVHSNFLIVEKVLSEKSLAAVCKYAPIPMRDGGKIEFYHGCGMEVRKVQSWEIAESYFETTAQTVNDSAAKAVTGSLHRMTGYKLTFEETIPDFVKKGTILAARCWEPVEYICTDSVYRNIAGAGHLLRCGEAEISGCRYENMMNAGILIGAEFDTHCEGGHGVNIKIHNNIFTNCGTKARYGEYGRGCIAIKSQGFSAPLNRNIRIDSNLFASSERALEIRDAANVEITGNTYRDISEKIFIDPESTEKIWIDE